MRIINLYLYIIVLLYVVLFRSLFGSLVSSSHGSFLGFSWHIFLVFFNVLLHRADSFTIDNGPNLHCVFDVLLESSEGSSLYEAFQRSHLNIALAVVFLPSFTLGVRNVFTFESFHCSLGRRTDLGDIHQMDTVYLAQGGSHSSLWFLQSRTMSIRLQMRGKYFLPETSLRPLLGLSRQPRTESLASLPLGNSKGFWGLIIKSNFFF